ncbi:MAG: bifunctional oligoribonuclease/PAP phosphatase NrnA [Prevotellaceae bacterium]|jgi:phosphoesterase RecJ-like protein|nr:bifunctional oligoribonuclease/PAP phosphatase NrnA [Prevotellaceae bacterium]
MMPVLYFAPENIEKFRALLQTAKRAVVVTHHNPDGDAIGTSLALTQVLKALGIDTSVIVPNPFPEFLHWMNGVKDILIYKHGHTRPKQLLSEADLLFCVDLNALSRMDALGKFISALPVPRVMIDHHLQPELKDFTIAFSDPGACSSAETFYHLMKDLGLLPRLNITAAEAIYTGMMTDTNGFRNNCSRPEVFYIIAELLQYGIDKDKIYNAVYNSYSYNRMRLLGYALEKMVVLPEYRTAYIALTKEEIASFHFQPGDTEGFVNYPLHIKDIVLSVFLSENQENIRLSFRSRGQFSVNEFARKHFEGGGHLNAAGGISRLTVTETIAKFIQSIEPYKDELSAV